MISWVTTFENAEGIKLKLYLVERLMPFLENKQLQQVNGLQDFLILMKELLYSMDECRKNNKVAASSGLENTMMELLFQNFTLIRTAEGVMSKQPLNMSVENQEEQAISNTLKQTSEVPAANLHVENHGEQASPNQNFQTNQPSDGKPYTVLASVAVPLENLQQQSSLQPSQRLDVESNLPNCGNLLSTEFLETEALHQNAAQEIYSFPHNRTFTGLDSNEASGLQLNEALAKSDDDSEQEETDDEEQQGKLLLNIDMKINI